MKQYPTPWQTRMLWSSLTALAFAVLIAVIVGGVWVTTEVISFLKPLLIPFAVSGVLAYLLDPVVTFLCRRTRMSRTRAVISIFAAIVVVVGLLGLTVVPGLYRQSVVVARKVPVYTQKLQQKLPEWLASVRERLTEIGERIPTVRRSTTPTPPPQATGDSETGAAAAATPAAPEKAKRNPLDAESLNDYFDAQVNKLQDRLPAILNGLGGILVSSIGGFFGIIGFIVSAIMIPFCLWYFLKEGDQIKAHWPAYLPLAPSRFKDELVAALTEINIYLVAFFRGQLIVSLIDGTLIGISLLILGLDFALPIGLMVVFFSLIPYIGIIVCWVPAVLIAALQFGDVLHPFLVTGIFFAVQQFEGFIVAPRVVGETVGLHPLTVILGVLGWSLVFGGVLGALLAIPLTATLKVLLGRYVWSRREKTLTATGKTAPVIIEAPHRP
jgi:predicted PurR-regulated permease PerM